MKEKKRIKRENVRKDWKRNRGEMRTSCNWLIVIAFDLECTKNKLFNGSVQKYCAQYTYYILHQFRT